VVFRCVQLHKNIYFDLSLSSQKTKNKTKNMLDAAASVARAKRTREKEERKSGFVVQEIGSGFFVVREEEFKEGRRRR